MIIKTFKPIILSFLLLCTIFSAVASAQGAGSDWINNAQTPAQVVVQIVLTVIVLRVLNYFDLP